MVLFRALAAALSVPALLALSSGSPAHAANEFVVNGFSEAWQLNPDIATLEDGGFIVAWDTYFQTDDDSFYFLIAQRFSPSGRKIGGEFILNDDLVGQSRHPALTALPGGGFAVAWENSTGSVLNETDVYTRVFDDRGEPVSASVRVHGKSTEAQYGADITTSGNSYFVTYTSYQGSKVHQHDDVFLQRFDARGRRRGAAVKINQATDLDQKVARLATLSNGSVLAVWDSESGGSFGGRAQDEMRGRIFTSSGRPATKEFVVSDDIAGLDTSPANTNTSSAVGALPGGGFVATWTETELEGSGSDTTFDVRGQVFDRKGRPVGREIIVRRSTHSVPSSTTVAVLRKGGFIVSWNAPGTRASASEDVYARIYARTGQPLGREFYINQYWRESDQEHAALAVTKGDRVLAVYESEYLDGDHDGIAGRVFRTRGGKIAPSPASATEVARVEKRETRKRPRGFEAFLTLQRASIPSLRPPTKPAN